VLDRRCTAARAPTVAFALKFILCFAVLMGSFEASRGSPFERVLVEDCILRPTVALIHALAPSEQIELVGRSIRSPSSRLNVTRGCEGVEIFLILAAGLLAFPATWKTRVHGLLVGSVVAYVLSISRLLILHFTLRYSPQAWEALHGVVLPLGPILIVSLYFLYWSDHPVPAATAATASHAP